MILYGMFCAGGFGREIMPLAGRMLSQRHGEGEYRLVFVEPAPVNPRLNGWDIMGEADFLASPLTKKYCVAAADAKLRRRLAAKLAAQNIMPFNVVAENAVLLDGNSIGEGHVLCPFVTITSNVVIGRQFHANLYSYVAHDCVIGDFVTLAPNVHCNGRVIIEDDAYIGAGAIIRHGLADAPLIIGRGAIVGMGAVVTKNVPPGVTVVGNPARVLEPRHANSYNSE